MAVNPKVETALVFFTDKGWSKEQAAGLVSNLNAESRLDVNSKGDKENGVYKAFGIAQWHPDRQAIFKEVYHKDIHDATYEEQLAYVDYELKHGYNKPAGDALKRQTSPAAAAAVVEQKYERSKLGLSGGVQKERVDNAIKFANLDNIKSNPNVLNVAASGKTEQPTTAVVNSDGTTTQISASSNMVASAAISELTVLERFKIIYKEEQVSLPRKTA